MGGRFYKYANFTRHQIAITAADSDFTQGPIAIRCLTAGNCIATDEEGTTLTYAMAVGEMLPTLIVRIAAASTGTYTGHY